VSTRPGSILAGLFLLVATGPGLAVGQAPIEVGESLSPLGPTLRLPNGTTVAPRSLKGTEGTVFVFWGDRCPWVDRYEGRIDSLARTFSDRGLRFVLVDASARRPTEPTPPGGREGGVAGQFVRDPDGRFARAVGAVRTPHAFVFDDTWTLRYAGAIDDSPSVPGAVERAYLREAVRALAAGRTVTTEPQTAFGCTLNVPE
jgi:hypothetical protein